jgi:hexulose-6-phosphate isomerase
MTDSLSRRDFLKAGGVVAAAALNPLGVAADKTPANKRSLQKAIMYATIGFKGSVLEKFQAVKAAGFAGVEPMSHMKQDEVLKALEKTGLKAASVCCNTHWAKPLSHPDAKERKEALAGLKQALRDAKRYGATSVLLVPGIVNKDATYAQCWKRSIGEIRKAIPLAKELGVKIAIENVWNNFITKPEQAKAYLEEINSPQVGWHFDIGNTIKYSPPEKWIPVLGKRIVKLHFKEYSKRIGFGVKFFQGDNDWPAIMKALDKVGYQGWGISEQPPDQSKDATAMKNLSSRMSKVFAS